MHLLSDDWMMRGKRKAYQSSSELVPRLHSNSVCSDITQASSERDRPLCRQRHLSNMV